VICDVEHMPRRRPVRGLRIGRRALAAAGLAALLGAFAQAPAVSAAPGADPSVLWLCAPELAENPCAGGLPTTDERDGSTSVSASTGAPVDCFYVYPTVSQDLTANARMKVTPALKSIARHQAARFSDVCTVYAPVYRQRTLTALAAGQLLGPRPGDDSARVAYGDVLTAWRAYLAERNDGRGVVLIGHSQGTGVLRRLIREEIDPDPAARSRLVSALLLGGTVAVRKGSDRGGDFQNIPLCRSEGQTGCVLTWASFTEKPPEDSLFGRVPR